jgi:regulator of protease activity HflC (stomatin/prohibitin superfamily)
MDLETVMWGAWFWTKVGMGLGVVALLVWKSVFAIQTQSAGIVERFHKFLYIAEPGLGFMIPFVDRVVDTLDLSLLQLSVDVSTKTKDNVFVNLSFRVQYRARADRIRDAFYLLEDEEDQIKAFVRDSVRSRIPQLTLEGLYEQNEQLTVQVKEQLDEVMEKYGWDITDALLTGIAPDAKVQSALNAVEEQRHLRMAEAERSEAGRIRVVAQAKADAEAKKLEGEGIAAQRKAIVDGLEASMKSFEGTGVDPREALEIMMLTQYFDMLRSLGAHGVTTIMTPMNPGGLSSLRDEITTALLASAARPGGPLTANTKA